MEIVLMHKNELVAQLIFTDAGYFTEIEGFYDRNLMPPGTRVQDPVASQRFKAWIEDRVIPKDRENYIKILSDANINTQEQFCFSNYCMNLNDCYWMQSLEALENSPSWDDINFFTNAYSPYVGYLLTEPDFSHPAKNFISPDLATNGNSKKMWYQDPETKESYFLKFGTQKNDYQEVYIEAAVCKIEEALGINHVHYDLIDKEFINGQKTKVAICKNFCSENVEFVSAHCLSVEPNLVGKNGMLNFLNKLNLKSEMDKILVLDYITCNPSRDFTNLGFLRNANTFESLGLAPVFSNGNSLWVNWKEYGVGQKDIASTFDSTHEKQIQLVDDFSWIKFDKLEESLLYVKIILSDSNIPQQIQNQICLELKNRINKLKNIAQTRHKEMIIKKENEIREKNSKKIELSESTSGGFGF